MNNDSRMLIYFSIMAILLSCVVLGYSLLLFGFGPQSNISEISLSPKTIIVAGLLLAATNAVATNVLSSQLEQRLTKSSLPASLKNGIPIAAFLATLAFSILVALLSN